MADAPLRGVIFIPPEITFRSLYGLATRNEEHHQNLQRR